MDTICAIATARAASAIGMIRVSGERAFEICDSFSRLRHGTLSEAKSARMYLGDITDGPDAVDQALFSVFRAPNSYTGEDIVEINCHGSLMILDRVMKLLIKNGARTAQNGEFTKRAFLNGRLDLVQAEAVGDLINAQSKADAALALSRISGKLSREFTEIFDALVSLNTDILAYIDFPDEGLSDADPQTVLLKLREIRRRLAELEKSFETGAVIRDGANAVIVGAPNVGKSTLLNSVLGYERSIVSDIEGTTRDVVSERATLGRLTLNLCDTAGIRDRADVIEQRGIELARQSLETADVVFAVFDGSRPLNGNDTEIAELCRKKTAIAVINKCDMPRITDVGYISERFEHTVEISAAQGRGIDKLAEAVNALFISDRLSVESGRIITNARHFERVVKAGEYTDSAINTLESGFTPDLASIDITEAAGQIGMITGASVSDKIIDEIFSKFCVGK